MPKSEDIDGYGETGWRRTKTITTLDQLLVALTPDHWACSTEVRYCKRWHLKPVVHVYHDRNYYVDTTQYDIDRLIVDQAIDRGYLKGVPKWGYTSDSEWVISDEGRRAAWAARDRAKDCQQTLAMGDRVIVDRDAGDE